MEALGEITWFSRGTEGDQLSPSENKGGGGVLSKIECQ